jgi:cytoskeletal protein CcmA (bactofilin family)
MFGHDKSNSQSNSKRATQTKDLGVTILTSGCHFTGKLFCRGATRIGGTIEGQVIAEGLLVIEDAAVITGEVDAEDIVIHGRVEGKIQGRNRIELCSTADVHADVTTPGLVIHDGALFNGKTLMKRKVTAQTSTDSKSNGKTLVTGAKKGEIHVDNGGTKALPDIRAARLANDHQFNLEPEPAI